MGAFGKEAGRVSIRVLPDASKFRAELKVVLEKVEARYRANPVKIKVEADLDTAKLRAQLKALAARSLKLTAEMDLDTAKLRAQLKAIEKKAASIDVTLKFNTAKLNKDVVLTHRRIQAWLKAHPIQIAVKIDTKALRTAILAHKKMAAYFAARKLSVGVDITDEEREILGAIAKMKTIAKAKPVKVPVEAKVRLKSLGTELAKVLGLSKASTILNSFTGRLIVFSSLIAALVPVAIGAGEALGVMSKSLLVLPAAGLAAAGAIGVLAYTFIGLRDSLDDYKKSDPMSKVAKSLSSSIDLIIARSNDLQAAIRRTVLPGLASLAGAVANVTFKPITDGMMAMARQVNLAFADLASLFQRAPFLSNLRKAFETTAPAVRSFGQALGWLITTFAALAAGAGPVLAEWAQATADAMGRLAVATEKAAKAGDIERWAREGGDAVVSFARSIRDFSIAVKNIGDLANVSGLGFLDGLEAATRNMREFTESARGAEVIRTVFAGLDRVLVGLGDFLAAIGPAASTAFLAIAEGIGPVSAAFFEVSTSVAKLISAFVQLPGVASAITVLTTAIIAYTVVMRVARVVTLAFSAAMAILEVISKASLFGQIILGLTLLVSALIYAYNHSETFRDVVDRAWKKVKEVMATVLEWVVGTLVPRLTAAWDWLVDALAPVVAFYVRAYGLIWQAMVAVWNWISGTLIPGIQRAWPQIVEALAPVVAFYVAYWTAIWDAIVVVWNWITGTLVPGIQQAWGWLVDALGPVVDYYTTAWEDIKAPMQDTWEWVDGTLVPGLSSAWDQISSDMSRLNAESVTIWTSLRMLMEPFYTWVNTTFAPGLSSSWDQIIADMNRLKAESTTIWAALRMIMEPFYSWVSSTFGPGLSAVWDWIATTLRPLSGVFSGTWGDIEGIVKRTFASILNIVTGGMSSKVSAIRNGVGQSKSAFSGIKSLIGTAKSTFSSIMASANSFRSSFIAAVRTAATQGVAGFRAGISGLVGAVTGALGSAVSAAAGWVGNFFAVGYNLASGIARGIASGVRAVIGAATSVVSRAVSAAQSAIASFSPSRLTARVVGEPFSQGIAVGIEDEAKGIAEAAVASLRNAVKDASAYTAKVQPVRIMADMSSTKQVPKEYLVAAAARGAANGSTEQGATYISGTFGYNPDDVAKALQKRRSRELATGLVLAGAR